MQAFLKKLGAFCLLTFVIFYLLGFFLEYQFAKDFSNKYTWIKNHRQEQFDYAFLGSSRVLNMVDISQIDQQTGQKGINLGVGGIDYRGMFLILHTFLEIRDNHLDQLFLQIDPFSIYKDSVYSKPRYDHNFFDVADDPVIRKCLDGKTALFVYKYFPIIKYIEYNKIFNIQHFIRSFTGSTNLPATRGTIFISNNKTFRRQEAAPGLVNTRLSGTDTLYLHKILRLARDKGVQVNLYTAPVYAYDDNFQERYPDYPQYVQSLTGQYGLPFYDFRRHFNSDTNLYSDLIHLNTRGTTRFTAKLLDEIPTFGPRSGRKIEF